MALFLVLPSSSLVATRDEAWPSVQGVGNHRIAIRED
jgi:hypothetical protein